MQNLNSEPSFGFDFNCNYVKGPSNFTNSLHIDKPNPTPNIFNFYKLFY